jgi:hypothetical protein
LSGFPGFAYQDLEEGEVAEPLAAGEALLVATGVPVTVVLGTVCFACQVNGAKSLSSSRQPGLRTM